MHDVLAHRISLVAMHAGALAYRTDLSQDETAKVAGVIQDNAHRALTDLREVLGGASRRPSSTGLRSGPSRRCATWMTLLPPTNAEPGGRIRLRNRAGEHVVELPDSIGRNAYRILQESLTNARKHAPNTVVDVPLASPADRAKRYLLLVRNPLPIGVGRAGRPEPAWGWSASLSALRSAAAGSTTRRQPLTASSFVRARLPWPP